MTNEMVERVARAIADADGDHTVMEHHRRRARAAIEAMREPTEAMIDAIPQPTHFYDKEYIRRDWRNMIDAALENKK